MAEAKMDAKASAKLEGTCVPGSGKSTVAAVSIVFMLRRVTLTSSQPCDFEPGQLIVRILGYVDLQEERGLKPIILDLCYATLR